jgi:hypothetical protein
MALAITIAGTDRTGIYAAGTLQISEKLDLRTVTTFQLLTTSVTPAIGEEVIVTDGATTHFLGMIQKIRKRLLNDGTTLRYWITCGDYSAFFQARTITTSYTSQTLQAIVLDIISLEFSNEGFTTAGVEVGPTLDKVTLNYVYAADAFDQLADLTGYHWYVDTDKDLHFEERISTTAPFDQTDASNNFLAGSLDETEDRKRYRNKEVVRAGTDLTASRTETIDGNDTRSYQLIYPAGAVPTIRIDIGAGFVSQTVGIRGLDTGKDWYWQKGDHDIAQDDGGTPLTVGGGGTDQIEVTYQGLYPLVVQAQDDTEIAARVAIEGGDGVYSHVTSEPDVDTLDGATGIAAGLLRRFGTIPATVQYQTDGAGLRSGQLQTINLTAHGVNDSFLISEVKAQDLGAGADGYLRYTISAVAGEYVGGWEKFFQNLIRGNRKFVLRENEVATILRVQSSGNEVDLEETVLTALEAAPETRAGFALADYSEVG